MMKRYPDSACILVFTAALQPLAARADTAAAQDPASLSLLHDIVMPDPAHLWWPPAAGWYVLAIAVIAAAAWGAWRIRQRRQAARYRVESLHELKMLRRQADRPQSAAAGLLMLLKRTALAAYPRTRVASLHGAEWWAFLDGSCGRPLFADSLGARLEELAYANHDAGVSRRDLQQLFKAAGHWIRRHQPADSLSADDGAPTAAARRTGERHHA